MARIKILRYKNGRQFYNKIRNNWPYKAANTNKGHLIHKPNILCRLENMWFPIIVTSIVLNEYIVFFWMLLIKSNIHFLKNISIENLPLIRKLFLLIKRSINGKTTFKSDFQNIATIWHQISQHSCHPRNTIVVCSVILWWVIVIRHCN